jgi:hypothetical protein
MTDKPIQQQTFLRLIGVGIDPDKDCPELYYLLLEADHDRPITDAGRIVFFSDHRQATWIAETYAHSSRVDNYDLEQPFMVCDIADTLHYITEGGQDTECSVLNSINLLLDLVDAISLPGVTRVLAILREIADYCTFSKDLTGLLREQSRFTADDRVNAIMLAIGAIVVHSHVVQSTQQTLPGDSC